MMKLVKFRTFSKQNLGNSKPKNFDVLDSMAIKWARRAEYYRRKKFKELTPN